METVAKCRYVRSSSQKIRIVANVIRGKKVLKALEVLTYINKKASRLLKQVLQSAVSNAEHNCGMSTDDLFVKRIFVDNGPSMKRIAPRAKGRANRILKRTSHITIVVASNK